MLQKLIVQNLRNIDELSLTFHQRCSMIYGGNGRGKSSILEAIFFLSHGRSFRTHLSQPMQQQGKEVMRIRAYCEHLEQTLHLAVEKTQGQKAIIRLNETNQSSLSQIATYLPTILIDTDSHRHYASGPKHRRQMIDWGLFYLEPSFMPLWRDYQKALLQRNHALKNQQADQHWQNILIEKGEAIHQLRRQYLKIWYPMLTQLWQQNGWALGEMTMHYEPGWSSPSLEEAMIQNLYQDQKQGYTQAGPHRADCKLKIQGQLIHHFLSQGQQKLMGTLIALSHIQCIHQHTGQASLCLIDDLAAELDVDTRAMLLSLLAKSPSQLIITSISEEIHTEITDHMEASSWHFDQTIISPSS